MNKLLNYVTYLELSYLRTTIEDAFTCNEQMIAGLQKNEILDAELEETLREINVTLARVARHVKRRRR